jgi:Icc-related predicted phosphoesterase
MRLFFSTDIHGSERCFLKFVNAAKAYRADALIMGGDITGKLLVPVVAEEDGTVTADVFGNVRTARGEDEAAELRKVIRQSGSYTVDVTRPEKEELDLHPDRVPQLFRRAILETLNRWFSIARERLEPAGIPVYVSAGNDDEPYVEEALTSAPWVTFPENKVVELPGGYEMISCGYSNKTPFDSPRELSETDLEARVCALADQVSDPGRAIFNLHCPPHNTSLDLAPELDADLRPIVRGGAMVMAPAGSLASRHAIERYQPMLSLHGHIHESRGAQRIGRTECFNPGSEYSEGVLRGVLAELKRDKVKAWQFTLG